ncbi:MAG: DEAD/DEAH box helicase [Candidatus Electryonea clarkiae]|nr:DEAD/DEAH box helicase [Candidatus Electryonea clarkiae]MDP8287634.1 DEAD/DEAH box helicase [Candidatus Electryonea clarkiae]
MIKIGIIDNKFNIKGLTQRDKDVLNQPIHSIFLKSYYQGERDQEGEAWILPLNRKEIDILQGITRHFSKYDLEVKLDKHCLAILREVEKGKQKYLKALKNGEAVKRGIDKDNIIFSEKILHPEFKRILKPLQLQALFHLLQVENGANFSVPGSGKTSIALAYYHFLKRKKIINGLLVIGPSSCFEPWEYEYLQCFKTKAIAVRISGKSKVNRIEDYLLAHLNDILLITYQSAAIDIDYLIQVLRQRKYLVVLDESHYIKKPQGGVLAEAVLKLAPYAKRRLILTGTPMPNDLADLWSQFSFLWHDQLPLGKADTYLFNIRNQEKEIALRRVKKAIYPLFFRITKSQLDLPVQRFRIMKCRMSPLQARIYNGVATKFLTQLQEAPKDRNALREWRRAKMVRLLQIASNPTLLKTNCLEFSLPPLNLKDVSLRNVIEHYADYEIPSKFSYICNIVKNLCDKNEKVVIWSTFIHNLSMLAKLLVDYNPVVVHGGIPVSPKNANEISREKLISKFKNDKKSKVLIANPAACAESISLHQVCHNAVYLDRSFNCAHYLQSIDRIHRLGLKPDQQTVYYLIQSEDSIDETVHVRLKEKMRNMRKVIEADFPQEVPGYWSEDLGEEEDRDYKLFEEHLRKHSP